MDEAEMEADAAPACLDCARHERNGVTIEVAARALVGVPFRLHGRSEAGLDCVGLVALAAWRAGHEGVAPTGYRVRGGEPLRFAGWLKAAGLRRVRRAVAGDVLLVRAGPAQFHLMLKSGAGFIHAHAGVGRVVEMPGPLGWPVISVWRFPAPTRSGC